MSQFFLPQLTPFSYAITMLKSTENEIIVIGQVYRVKFWPYPYPMDRVFAVFLKFHHWGLYKWACHIVGYLQHFRICFIFFQKIPHLYPGEMNSELTTPLFQSETLHLITIRDFIIETPVKDQVSFHTKTWRLRIFLGNLRKMFGNVSLVFGQLWKNLRKSLESVRKSSENRQKSSN